MFSPPWNSIFGILYRFVLESFSVAFLRFSEWSVIPDFSWMSLPEVENFGLKSLCRFD